MNVTGLAPSVIWTPPSYRGCKLHDGSPLSSPGRLRPASVADILLPLGQQVPVSPVRPLEARQGHAVPLLLVARRAQQGQVVVGVTPAVVLGADVVHFQHPGIEAVVFAASLAASNSAARRSGSRRNLSDSFPN